VDFGVRGPLQELALGRLTLFGVPIDGRG